MKGVTILGSTGSIGVNTLDVVSRHQDDFRVVALTAHTDDSRMAEQVARWNPEYAVMADPGAAQRLSNRLRRTAPSVEVLAGRDGLDRVASLPQVEIVMAAIVGAAGLMPTLAAARAGKRVLLANKESLVMSGKLLIEAVRSGGAQLLPIDSEHNAIFQCMPPDFSSGLDHLGVRRILLTASGGPFLNRTAQDLAEVTPDEACAHPRWVMGRKISVDSATMMNKGLEVIEACWLFDTEPDRVQVVIHPQSVVHSMVEYVDGSILAQLGNPDMRTPIAHALGWPRRMESGVDRLDVVALAELCFERPSFDQFPCLRLGYEAARQGGTAATILNAANEVAVEAFLGERLRFTDIPRVLEDTLSRRSAREADTLDTVMEDDAAARQLAMTCVSQLSPAPS